MSDRARIIAVDFDGCLCENAWPDIGEAKQDVIDALLLRQKVGAKIILWTCRVGERLDAAVRWCADHGITFDAINENLPVNIVAFGNDCRKVYADEYWDDKAVMPEPFHFIVDAENLGSFRSPGYSVLPVAPCEITIPFKNPLDGPHVTYVCPAYKTEERISDNRIATMRDAEPALPIDGPLEKYGSMTVKHPWFSATRAVLDYFAECIEHEKRAQIVIDYDPQAENTKITYYRQIESQEVAHG